MMFWLALLPAVASLSRVVTAGSPPAQRPLVDHPDDTAPDRQGDDGDGPPPPQWTLDFTSPLPHLFASVPSLLHQWSNTIFPNGQALAAVEIPAYTLLYHGLISPEDRDPQPPSPEWLAFDPEMSYGIMGSSRHSFLLTYQATRPVRAVYFDGESAALMGFAQMDTQMLHLFGNVSGPPGGPPFGLGVEYLRAHGLCGWLEEAGLGGRGWGFEGVVRMNAGFEMIWCDFSSPSLRLMSRLNVTAPLLPPKKKEEGEEQQRSGDGDEARGATTAGAAMLDNVDDLSSRARGTHQQQQQQPQPQQPPPSYYPLPPQPTRTGRDSEPSNPAPPPNWRRDAGREPFLRAQGWGWFDSATWHYGSTRGGPGRGEARARVLGCGVLSYYSPRFAGQARGRALRDREGLNLTAGGRWAGPGEDGDRGGAVKRLARRRRYHHLGDVAPEEASLMRRDSERAFRSLAEPGGGCSGADWVLMTSEIVQRTTNQLTMMDTGLSSFPPAHARNETAVYDWLSDLRGQSHMFMVAYLEYPPDSLDHDAWSTKSALYEETYSRCRYRYTRLLVPEERRVPLSPEEEDIRLAVEEVYGTICSVLLTMGFGIEQAWLDVTGEGRRTGHEAPSSHVDATALARKVGTWRENIIELTAWLGWESEYYGCKEVCAWDERCYIPMWPMIAPGNMGPGHGGGGGGGGGPGKDRGPPPEDRPGGRPGGGYASAPEADDDHRPPPPPPGHNGTGPGRPGFKMPPRGPWWMGDDTDLFEPKCVNINYIMGQR